MKTLLSVGLTFLLLIVLTACSEPPVPPEIQQATGLAEDLRRSGADVYAPRSFREMAALLDAGHDRLTVEQDRLAWFRDYREVAETFRAALARGEQARSEMLQSKARQTRELQDRSAGMAARLQALRDLAAAVKDSRLNTGNLVRIEVLLSEARSFTMNSQPDLALERLGEADVLLGKTVSRIRPILAQFVDAEKIATWKTMVDEAVAESRRRGGQAIVVNKLRRQLLLYNRGVVIATYPVGLGFKPIGDKLYAGDRATPEGRYEVVSKLPNSAYYRALLINYPNDEDRRRFAEAKRKKLIPANASIGGLIEIHGGGKDGATLGCIGLNDPQMLDLFNRVEVGTPVVIVAAMNNDNLVSMALGKLQ